jgi:hypothetical protein
MPLRIMTAMILLLLPIACLAQNVGPGWTSDPATGCRVINAHPQPNESMTWSGDCHNGFAQGQGVLRWFENGQPGERYEGELKNGQMDGHGTLSPGDGGRYEGEFRDGMANGLGQWSTARGSFSGVWKNGCFKDGNRRAWVGADPSSCP